MDKIIISIFEAESEEGFFYDIYGSQEDLENGEDALDGGLCTSTIQNALEMAYHQAMDLLNKK